MNRLSSPVVERLRAARVERGLSQAALAERIGTTQSAIARLESGHSDPRLSTLERYARAVGVEPTFDAGRMEAPALERTADEIRASLRAGDAGEALRHVIQFLDDIDGADRPAVRQAVRAEPDGTGDERWDALLAGVAEYASRRAGLSTPGWASAPGRFLRKFWFVVEELMGRPMPGLAVLSVGSASPELASRGVFLDRASLESV
ncbi:MAG TPA: helix-turn-helix domain-containing protein [Glycomyces sp.]|nr:helix-turn-helix domain-containing protein [Glycomyces sp.]